MHMPLVEGIIDRIICMVGREGSHRRVPVPIPPPVPQCSASCQACLLLLLLLLLLLQFHYFIIIILFLERDVLRGSVSGDE